MSLSCKSSMFCESSYSPYYVKIVYNKLDKKECDLVKIKTFYERYSNIADNIDNLENIKDILESIENRYINPSYVKQTKFIFLGKINDVVRSHLSKIENNVRDKMLIWTY